MSILSRLLWLVAIGLLLAAAFMAWRPTSSLISMDGVEPAVEEWTIDDSERDCGLLSEGEHEIVFEVRNHSTRPRRIIGLSYGCKENCCYKPCQQEPVTVPPGGSYSYPCAVSIYGPGPFELKMALFLEDNGIGEKILTVRGSGAMAGKDLP